MPPQDLKKGWMISSTNDLNPEKTINISIKKIVDWGIGELMSRTR
jgi:hypothetical protein